MNFTDASGVNKNVIQVDRIHAFFWCGAGGDNGTGACCDTCCADNSCPTDHPDNSCEQAETTVVSQVCPAQNAACGVTCSGGVARCDIVDLKEGTYPGSSAAFKRADGTGEQCCYGTVYVDANGEKDNGRS